MSKSPLIMAVLITAMITLLLALGGAGWALMMPGTPRPAMSLHDLPKDIIREPVPVSGKVKGLAPPKLGEHDHAH